MCNFKSKYSTKITKNNESTLDNHKKKLNADEIIVAIMEKSLLENFNSSIFK